MSKNKPILFASLAFLVAEATLGVLVQVLRGNAVVAVSYAAVLLAFAFAFLFFERTPRYLFTQTALLFTIFADYFLVVRGAEEQFLAMLFFSLTQLAYGARLYFEEKSPARRNLQLALRIGVSIAVIAVTFLVLGGSADRVALISMFYFANLALNAVLAFLRFEKPGFFAIGLALFLCCDVCIGLSLIESYLPLAEGSLLYRLAHPGFNLAWVFYVPSQALLALSLLPAKLKGKTIKT